MKKILFYLTACILLLSACETESDEWRNGDYLLPDVSFINVSATDYQVLFNGKELSFLPLTDLTGELNVYDKENNTLVLDITVTFVPNQSIQLVKLLDQSWAVYSEEDFSYFSVDIPYTYDQGNAYQVFYDGQEVAVGKDDIGDYHQNFIPVNDELTGTLQVYKNDETSPVLDQEITIDSGQTINLVQLPDEEIRIDLSDEEDPANRNSIKVRFLHNTRTGSTGIDLDSIRVDVFATVYSNRSNYNQYDSIGSVVAKFNLFSPYVELDLATYYEESNPTYPVYLGYKLYDAYTGDPVKQTTSYNGKNSSIWKELVDPDEGGPRGKYKFLTYRFSKLGSNYNTVFVYGIEWGTTE